MGWGLFCADKWWSCRSPLTHMESYNPEVTDPEITPVCCRHKPSRGRIFLLFHHMFCSKRLTRSRMGVCVLGGAASTVKVFELHHWLGGDQLYSDPSSIYDTHWVTVCVHCTWKLCDGCGFKRRNSRVWVWIVSEDTDGWVFGYRSSRTDVWGAHATDLLHRWQSEWGLVLLLVVFWFPSVTVSPGCSCKPPSTPTPVCWWLLPYSSSLSGYLLVPLFVSRFVKKLITF